MSAFKLASAFAISSRRAAALACAVLAITVSSLALAQGPPGPKYASAKASAKPSSVAPGGKGSLIITLAIAPEFHVNSNRPKDPDLIATAFVPNSTSGVHYGPAQYPASKTVMSAGAKVSAFTNTIQIVVPFTVAKSVKAGKTSVGGKLTYQGCNASACYPPTTDQLSAAVLVK